jgi:hypothetical protein
MTRQDEIQLWRTRIETAEAQLRPQVERWRRTLRAYRGIFHPDEVDEEARRDGVNHALSILGRTIPRLYYRDPVVRPLPRLPDPVVVEGAKAIKAYLEQTFRRLKVGRETRKILYDAFICSEGYAKVGYQAVFEDSGQAKDQIGASLPAFPEAVGLDDRATMLKEGRLSKEDVAFDDRLRSEELFMMRVHPAHVLHDPDALEPEQAKWMAHVIPRRIEDIRNTKVYNQTVASMLSPATPGVDIWLPSDDGVPSADVATASDYSEGWAKVIEIWDRESGRVLVHAPDANDWLRDPRDWPYKFGEFPLERLQFNYDIEKWWGQPDLEAWLPMIEDLNFYRLKRRHRIKRNVSKWVGDSTALTEEAKDALSSQVEGDIALVNAQDAKPRDVLTRVDPAGSPPDIGVAEAREKEDLSNVSAMTQQRRGSQGTYTTATEASIIEVAAQENEAERLSTVREFQQGIARRLLSLARQYHTIPKIVGAAGPEGFKWYAVGDEIMRHNYDVEIAIGSSRYISEDQLLQGRQAFFGLMAQTGFAFGDPVLVLRDLAEMLRLPDPDRYVPDPNDEDGLRRMAALQMYRQIMGIQAPQQPGANGQGGGGLAAMTEGGIAGAPNTLSPEQFAGVGEGGV